jgi:hypothetical protein
MPMRFSLPLFVFAGLIFCLAGCSGATGPQIKGQVLLDGKPVAGARVEFHGKGGSVAVTDDEGKFYLDGTAFKKVEPGSYIVRVSKYVDRKTGKAPNAEEYDQLVAAGTIKNSLPEKYGAAEMNPLTAEIKEGLNELKPFELKSK